MKPRAATTRIAIGALLCCVLLAAGCSSSGDDEGGPTSSTTPQTLAEHMKSGLAGVKSAHVEINLGSLGGKSSEEVRFTDGEASASRITRHAESGEIVIVTVDGKSYAKLPATQKTSDEPWVILSAESTNPVVARLATGSSLARASASLSAITDLVASAKSVTEKGSDDLDGVSADHYRVEIVPSAGSGDLSQMLRLLGKDTIPIDLWLDDQWRPVKFTLDVTAAQQHISVQVRISEYNEPVEITAPPADKVGTA